MRSSIASTRPAARSSSMVLLKPLTSSSSPATLALSAASACAHAPSGAHLRGGGRRAVRTKGSQAQSGALTRVRRASAPWDRYELWTAHLGLRCQRRAIGVHWRRGLWHGSAALGQEPLEEPLGAAGASDDLR